MTAIHQDNPEHNISHNNNQEAKLIIVNILWKMALIYGGEVIVYMYEMFWGVLKLLNWSYQVLSK